MTRDELLSKFEKNARTVIPAAQCRRLIAAVSDLESATDASTLVQLSIAGDGAHAT